jgi:hypothetical protein
MVGIDELTLKQLKKALEEAEQDGYVLFPEGRSVQQWKRSTSDPKFASFWAELRELGESYRDTQAVSLPFSEFTMFGQSGERKTYEAKYFERRTRLSVLTILVMVEGREQWGTALENIIWSTCEESTWVFPAHVGLYHNDYPNGIWDQPEAPRETVDLFAAITAYTLAEIVSLVGELLHPWIVKRVSAELDRRIFQVYFNDPTPQNWEMKTNNWPAVCAAGIGAAAMYEEKNSERLSGMLWRIIAAMRNHLLGFDEEGATSEGVAYWQFGFGFYVYFSELLKERTGGRIDLLQGEKVEKIARFPNVCLLSGGMVVNFSDAPDRVDFLLGLFSRLKQRFGDVMLPEQEPAIDQLFRYWPNAGRLLVWTTSGVEAAGEREEGSTEVKVREAGETIASGSIETKVRESMGAEEEASTGTTELISRSIHEDYYFSGHQWVISKSHSSEGFVAFAAKGGHNEEPHNHNDLGHFLLHVDGQTILADLGAGMYTRQYFQTATRYEMLTAGSHGHSVPIIDGCRQSLGRTFQAKVLHYEKSMECVSFKLDLSKAYDCAKLVGLTREFAWNRPEQGEYSLVVRDSFHFSEQPASLVEVFISSVEPQVIKPGLVRLDALDMLFDAQQVELTIDPQQVTGINGVERTIFRLLLTVKEVGRQLVSEVSFHVRGERTSC